MASQFTINFDYEVKDERLVANSLRTVLKELGLQNFAVHVSASPQTPRGYTCGVDTPKVS